MALGVTPLSPRRRTGATQAQQFQPSSAADQNTLKTSLEACESRPTTPKPTATDSSPMEVDNHPHLRLFLTEHQDLNNILDSRMDDDKFIYPEEAAQLLTEMQKRGLDIQRTVSEMIEILVSPENPSVPETLQTLSKTADLMANLEQWKTNETTANPENSDNINKASTLILDAFTKEESRLYLTRLELTSLPDCLGSLSSLRLLDVGCNNISELPGSLNGLKNLENLTLNNNSLESLPDQLLQEKQLALLDISNNPLNELDPKTAKCLPLHNPRFIEEAEGVNSKFSACELLKHVHNCGIDRLAFAEHVSSTFPADSPASKHLLAAARFLADVDAWQAAETEGYPTNSASIESTARDIKLSYSTGIPELHLAYRRLRTLPKAIAELKHLKVIQVTGNELTHIPEEISSMGNLEDLRLGSNNLQALPESLFQLGALQKLDVSGNRDLSALPDDIGASSALQSLKISGTSVSELPEDFDHFKKLTDFSANHCCLTTLPSSIGNCKSLKKLSLEGNLLSTLPRTIHNCEKLNNVNLKQNPFGTKTAARIKEGFMASKHKPVTFSIDSMTLFECLQTSTGRASLDSKSKHIRLSQLLDELRPSALSPPTMNSKQWDALKQEDIPTVTRLLTRVPVINDWTGKPIQKEKFIAGLRRLLSCLATSELFRARAELIAQDAIETCEDRATMGFIKLFHTMGAYTPGKKSAGDIYKLAQRGSRIEALQEKGKQHAERVQIEVAGQQTRNNSNEELETALKFVILGQKKFGMPSPISSMKYDHTAAVSSDSIVDAARKDIQSKEPDSVYMHMAGDDDIRQLLTDEQNEQLDAIRAKKEVEAKTKLLIPIKARISADESIPQDQEAAQFVREAQELDIFLPQIGESPKKFNIRINTLHRKIRQAQGQYLKKTLKLHP